MTPTLPYIYQLTVYESDGSTRADSVTVTAVNKSTNEAIQSTANSNGVVVFDFANFTSGYDDGDIVFISVGDFKHEGQKICDWLARQVRKQIKSNWVNELKNTLWNPEFIQNNPVPYEEDRGIFRRVVEIQLNAISTGE